LDFVVAARSVINSGIVKFLGGAIALVTTIVSTAFFVDSRYAHAESFEVLYHRLLSVTLLELSGKPLKFGGTVWKTNFLNSTLAEVKKESYLLWMRLSTEDIPETWKKLHAPWAIALLEILKNDNCNRPSS
jgi:hypothetical protein